MFGYTVEKIQRDTKIELIVAEYDYISGRAKRLCRMYRQKDALSISREDIEDLVQVTYLKAIVNIKYFNPSRGSARNWVFMMLKQILNSANKRAYNSRFDIKEGK